MGLPGAAGPWRRGSRAGCPRLAGRVAVLGLDGMPPGYLAEAARAGVLPSASRILSGGVVAGLRALIPATWPSWTTIMTGVREGWHGVTGFFAVDRARRESRLMTAWDLMHPRVTEVADFKGFRVVAVNPVPETPVYPLRRGVTVSWFLYQGRPVGAPARLVEEWFGGVERVRVGGCGDLGHLGREVELVRGFVEEHAGDADLVWVNLRVPDHAFHKCPEAIDDPERAAPALSPADGLLRFLTSSFDSVILVSDHGFAKYKAQVSVNDILARAGLARARRGVDESIERVRAGGRGRGTVFLRVPPGLYRLIVRLRLAGPARAALRLAGRLIGAKVDVQVSSDVDVGASRAALLHDIDHGVVAFDEQAVGEALRVLRAARGVAVARPADEALAGPYARRSFDILVLPDYDGGFMLANRFIRGVDVVPTPYHGHHPLGVVAVYGDAAESPLAPRPGSTVDNTLPAALVYCLLGLPLPARSPHARVAGRCGVGVGEYAGWWMAKKRLLSRLRRR